MSPMTKSTMVYPTGFFTCIALIIFVIALAV